MNRGVHRFALLVAGATFFLIIAGALVTSHDAGLATSDWPLTDGRFLPKIESLGIRNGVNMVGNLFWEHGHRMVATTVGLLTIVLLVLLLWKEPRRWVRRLGVVALVGVIAQGILGGLTVKLMLPLAVSSAHATLAQLFFCTTVSLAVFTSASWIRERPVIEEQGSCAASLSVPGRGRRILVQLVIGATLRHSATWDKPLPLDLLLTHIGGALTVTVLLGGASLTDFAASLRRNVFDATGEVGAVVVEFAIASGCRCLSTRAASPNDPQPLQPMVGITVAHVACGALVFATTIVLTLRAFKVLAFERASGSALGQQAFVPSPPGRRKKGEGLTWQ